jgi:hypothetical protein
MLDMVKITFANFHMPEMRLYVDRKDYESARSKKKRIKKVNKSNEQLFSSVFFPRLIEDIYSQNFDRTER